MSGLRSKFSFRLSVMVMIRAVAARRSLSQTFVLLSSLLPRSQPTRGVGSSHTCVQGVDINENEFDAFLTSQNTSSGHI